MSNYEKELEDLVLAPWILKATALIGKRRLVGGNAFRHAMATLSICLDYKYFNNPILLKSSLVHDLLEDIPYTNIRELRALDSDANAVVDLVLEVTRREDETKIQYLERILKYGSFNAKVLKISDRLSNITDMNRDIYTDSKMLDYLEQTETYVLPMARQVNHNMAIELHDLIENRKITLSKKVDSHSCLLFIQNSINNFIRMLKLQYKTTKSV